MADTMTDQPRRSTRRRVAFVGAVVLAVVVAAVVFSLTRPTRYGRNCAGVLIKGREAATPAAALDSYLAQREQYDGVTIDRTGWVQQGDSFVARDLVPIAVGNGQTMWSVSVDHLPDGLYAVSGACVGSP